MRCLVDDWSGHLRKFSEKFLLCFERKRRTTADASGPACIASMPACFRSVRSTLRSTHRACRMGTGPDRTGHAPHKHVHAGKSILVLTGPARTPRDGRPDTAHRTLLLSVTSRHFGARVSIPSDHAPHARPPAATEPALRYVRAPTAKTSLVGRWSGKDGGTDARASERRSRRRGADGRAGWRGRERVETDRP